MNLLLPQQTGLKPRLFGKHGKQIDLQINV